MSRDSGSLRGAPLLSARALVRALIRLLVCALVRGILADDTLGADEPGRDARQRYPAGQQVLDAAADAVLENHSLLHGNDCSTREPPHMPCLELHALPYLEAILEDHRVRRGSSGRDPSRLAIRCLSVCRQLRLAAHCCCCCMNGRACLGLGMGHAAVSRTGLSCDSQPGPPTDMAELPDGTAAVI